MCVRFYIDKTDPVLFPLCEATVQSPMAICDCGYCFYYGRHQAVDYAEAYRWFSIGALLYNDANCLYKMGDFYLDGYAVEKNEIYAFKMYERALERCGEWDDNSAMPDAQFRVGKCLLHGIGTAKNIEKST